MNRGAGISNWNALASVMALALMGVSACAKTEEGQTAASVTIRFPQAVSESHPRMGVIKKFGQRLEQETQGRIKVQSFPGGTLYGAREAVRSATVGDVEMALEPETHFITFDDAFRAIDVPFQFDTPESFQQFTNTTFRNRVEPSLEKAGLTLIAFWDEGPMIVAGPRLLKTPDDFKGLKVRSSGHELLAQSFNEMGAATINIPIQEVYAALQQGVAGAIYTTFNTFVSGKTYEVAPKVVRWPARGVYPWVANRAFVEKLSEADRTTLRRLADEATVEYNKLIWGNYDELVKTVKAAQNGEFYELTSAESDAFKVRLKPLLDRWHAEFASLLPRPGAGS